ncbi:unnamed protein product [Adineta steineri]|uniref:Uncharacterized protein n=1 Tax=Adineta steineri TaxID=433720 RepID=A0A814ZQP7_9BILA|nr:unnamed protein product [Adineta steineri]CAF1531728.1 unnamed protein product [Adineta steineri]
MPEVSDLCQHGLCCLKGSSPASTLLYPCLHHCKKMLCITHLNQHHQYITEQIQFQTELKHLWSDYNRKFNEEQIRKELESFSNMILENYQKLKENVNSLLSTKHSDQSIDKNEKLKDAIVQVNRSKSMLYATSDSNQNSNVNVSTTDNGVCSEVTNNNEHYARPIVMEDRIRKMTTTDLMTSEILVFSRDTSDEKKAILFSSSKNLCMDNQCDQTNLVGKQPTDMKATTSSSGELPETQPISPPNQEALQKPESISTLKDTHNVKQLSVTEINSQSSEDSCY